MAGIYVHIPFCSSFCLYCDFYSIISKSDKVEVFKEGLLNEIYSRQDFFKKRGVFPETLYFGGGTPSLLFISDLEEITEAIKKVFGVNEFREFTIEVNPDDVSVEKLECFRRIGVNRISMGVQSFCDNHLLWMRRRHSATQAKEAFRLMREHGFDNISIDLIFGFSGLSRGEWEYNISQALILEPEHISCYQMSVEPGSNLASLLKSGEYVEPLEEESAWQYEFLQRKLLENGYIQYEISNYSLPGFKSIHNSNYWERSPYLGLGPSAHSFDGNRIRRWNSSNIIKNNEFSEEILSDIDIFNEQIMLGLRKTSGFSLESLSSSLLARVQPLLKKLVANGDLILNGDNLFIPSSKLFVSDGIMANLFVTD